MADETITLERTSRLPEAPRLPAASLPPALKPVRRTVLSGLRAGIAEALEHRRLFLLWPFAVIAGLIVSLAPPEGPDPALLAFVAAGLLVLLLLTRRQLAAHRVVGLLAAFWLGFSLLAIHAAAFGTAMLARPAYGTYEVRIDEIVSEAESGVRAIVSAITPVGRSRELPIRRARVVIAGASPVAPGDVVRGPIRFYPVPGPVLPNGFDTQFHAFFDGIGAYGSTTGAVTVIGSSDPGGPARLIDGIRRGIAARIDAVLPQPTAGIVRALITGDQSEVTDAARDTMAAAGLAHVLSVSGLHLTLVAGLVMVTLRGGLALVPGVHSRLPVKRLAALGGILAALCYFAISGGNVAALRSTIMIVLVLGAVVFGRRALTMRNVAIAALAILILDPASVFRPSFQLSFAAVVALIAAWELYRPEKRRDNSIVARIFGYFLGIIVTSGVAGLATLLFSVYHFQQSSPLGILGNLFSLPLVGFIMMPTAVLATLLMPFGGEAFFLGAMGWSIDRMLELGTLVAAWGSGLDYSPLLTPLALLLGLAALAWFVFVPTWHRLVAPVLLLPAVLLFALDRQPDVIIADTTQAVAVRGADGLGLVAGKGDSFAVDVWR